MAAILATARRRRRQQLHDFPRFVIPDRMNPMEILPREKIKQLYRFFPETIMYILSMVPDLRRRTTGLPPLWALLATLRYLATGGFQILIGEMLRLSQSSVCRSLWQVVQCLLEHRHQFVLWHPNRASVKRSKQDFFNIAGA